MSDAAANSAPPKGLPRKVVQLRHVHDWRPAAVLVSEDDLGGGSPTRPKINGVEARAWVCAECGHLSLTGGTKGTLHVDPGSMISYPLTPERVAFAVLDYASGEFTARVIAETSASHVRDVAGLCHDYERTLTGRSPWRISGDSSGRYCTIFAQRKIMHMKLRVTRGRTRYRTCERCSARISPGTKYWTTSGRHADVHGLVQLDPVFCDACVRGEG